MEVGLGPGHSLLDEGPAPPPQKGHSPRFSAHLCCGQTSGWISMPFGLEVGHIDLRPGDVLHGYPASPPQKKNKGHSTPPPNCGPCIVLWPNCCTDQDTISGAGLCPGHIVLGLHPPPAPIFSPCLLWQNGWMDQDATWYGGRRRPRRHCVRRGLSSPQRDTAPNFGPCLFVARRLNLVRR